MIISTQPTEERFYEAWISSKGELYIDGTSHWKIAHNVIKLKGDPLYNPAWDLEFPDDDYYDACYNWMWENGYGRIVRHRSSNAITISTSRHHPEHRMTLIKKSKDLCKRLNINSLVCDRTGRTLWCAGDTL